MRIETRKIFTFDELSEESQEKAIENYREYTISDPIPWSNEIFDSMKAIFDLLHIKLLDWQLGAHCYSYIKFEIDQDTGDLSGSRAIGWIENNLIDLLRVTRGSYLKNRKDYFRYGYRVGKVKDCPLTGVCFDHDFLDSLLDSIKSGMTIKDSLSGLADTYQRLLEREYEASQESEYIREELQHNGMEFLENGEIY